MNKAMIKKILLGEIGAGILLIIIQAIGGFHFDGSIPYMIGSNIAAVFGIASIIDGIRRINSENKNIKKKK